MGEGDFGGGRINFQTGLNPLLLAFLTEPRFDHAQDVRARNPNSIILTGKIIGGAARVDRVLLHRYTQNFNVCHVGVLEIFR